MTSIPKQPVDKGRRRKRFARIPPEKEPELSNRDLSILNTILVCGGVLSTIQISMLFWPPSLPKRLRWWGIDQIMVEQLLAGYRAGLIDEKTQLGRWLIKVKKDDPVLFSSLHSSLTSISLDPQTWLVQAITQDLKPPAAFLSRLRFPNQYVSTACTQRLRLLYDAEWVDKDEPATKLHQGRGQTLWYLSQRARNYLAKMRKISVKQLNWKAAGSFGQQHLPHRLAINDFRISVTLAANRLGYELKKWRDEDDLRKVHTKQKVELLTDPKDPDSKTVARWLIPDSYWWLDTGNNWYHFVEIDKGTETLQYADPSHDLQYWELKIRKYGEYFKTWYEQTYPEAEGRGRILTVTTSDTRLAHMAAVCCEVAGKAAGRYWLTTFDKIAPAYDTYFLETILTGEIWQRADKLDELRTLIW